MRREYSGPAPSTDRLYKSDVVHPTTPKDALCKDFCSKEPANLVQRKDRDPDDDITEIRHGLIGSGNSLMKDANVRDAWAAKGVLCFEMEAAGLMNRVPCLVVRGICDYSDSHKNKEWQGYAALAAGVYAKEFLELLRPQKVEEQERIMDKLQES